MARAAPSLVVTPQMLKHFAAFTVFATLVLAMFASTAQSDSGEGNAQLAAASHEAAAKPVHKGVKDKRRSGGGGGGGGISGGGGSGEISPDTFEHNWSEMAGPTGESQGPVYYAQGVSPLELAKKDPLGEKLKREQARRKVHKPTEEELSQLVSASRNRAGAADDSDTAN